MPQFSAQAIVSTIFDRADIDVGHLRQRERLMMLFNTHKYNGHHVIERPQLLSSYMALFSQGMDAQSLQVLRDAQIETLANEFGIYLFWPMGRVDSHRHLGIPEHFQYRTGKAGFEEEYRDELTYMVGAYMTLNPSLFHQHPV